MMVASGQADIWIEPSAAAWDFAPLKIIIEEAGGLFMNFDGGSSIHGGSCIACTPGLRDEAVRFAGG
jgi:histidinol-phosphatase